MAIKFYRKLNPKTNVYDFYEVGTNRYIGPTEFNRGQNFVEVKPNNVQQTTQPQIKRENGYVQELVNPLDKWKNQTSFIEAAKEIIQRKQKYNKDIQAGKNYWRTLAADTSPFGGQKAPEAQLEGSFNDERFRQLSPAEQASVRASRYAAAQANLRGLDEEQKYRESRTEDIINALNDLWKEKDKLSQDELNKQNTLLKIAEQKQKLGLPVTAQDLGLDTSKGVGTKIGGSVSWRHNNPLNIKFGNFAKQYGATQGQKASDGGSFAVFPNVETGLKAAKDLLTGPSYSNLTLDQAFRKWSNNSYGLKDVSQMLQQSIPNVKVKDLSDNQIDNLLKAMMKREGWKEGTDLSSNQSAQHVYWTKSAIRSLAKKLNKTSDELGKLTDSQLDRLAYQNSNDLIEKAYKQLSKVKLVKNGINQDLAKDLLQAMYQKYSEQEIKNMLQGIGQDPSIYDTFLDIINNSGDDLAELRALITEQSQNQ